MVTPSTRRNSIVTIEKRGAWQVNRSVNSGRTQPREIYLKGIPRITVSFGTTEYAIMLAVKRNTLVGCVKEITEPQVALEKRSDKLVVIEFHVIVIPNALLLHAMTF